MKTTIYLRSSTLLLCLLVFSAKIFSQVEQWTWIKGDSTVDQPGNYGTITVPSLSNKPGARSESASWKDKSGNFWLFGGVGYGSETSHGQLNDLWKYDPATNNWVWVKGPKLPLGNAVYGTKGIAAAGNIPGSRAMSASWTDNTGNLWLFGGTGNSYFNDLWKFDIITNQWTWVNGDNNGNAYGIYGIKGIASSTNKPGARNNPVCWADRSGNLWLFGGNGYAASGPGGRLSDLWKYDIAGNRWTWMSGDSVTQSLSVYGNLNISSASNKPGARLGASGWSDQSGNLWLMGGLGYASRYGVLNDMWKYNISSNEWVWVHGDSTVGHPAVYVNASFVASPVRPGAVHNAVTWTDANGNAWLYGGRGYTTSAFGELNALWKYNISSNEWSFVKGDPSTFVAGDYGVMCVPAETNKPGSREKPMAWTDSIGNIWMFGGESYPLNTTISSYQSDLWKFSLIELLPVKLFSFDGKQADKNILLNWVVENETKFDHYEIEKSYDGLKFQKTGSVKGTNSRNYNFTDYNIISSTLIFYRLKMVDIDGKFIYSNIINFHVQQTEGFVLFPNPANTYTQLRFNKNIQGEILIEIKDAGARMIIKKSYDVNGSALVISTDKLVPGNYTITIIYNKEKYVQKLVRIK